MGLIMTMFIPNKLNPLRSTDTKLSILSTVIDELIIKNNGIEMVMTMDVMT